MLESLIARAARMLQETNCPACGRKKDGGRPLCRVCFYRLPQEKRWEMGKTFSEGFAEAYDEALEWLRVN